MNCGLHERHSNRDSVEHCSYKNKAYLQLVFLLKILKLLIGPTIFDDQLVTVVFTCRKFFN